MKLTKQEIRDRLKYEQKWITTSNTNIFASDVDEYKIRYIVKIILTGDQSTTRVAEISKKLEAGSYDTFIPNINVVASEKKEIPEGSYDIEDPIITLEGGTNLAGKVSGNSISMTVIYWDNDI
jgi:hypothetical protein